jgi:Amt family ammonium transporter
VGIFGLEMFGGMGGVTFMSQLIGSVTGVAVALVGGFFVYGLVHAVSGVRLTEEEEYNGADLSIHKIASTSDD